MDEYGRSVVESSSLARLELGIVGRGVQLTSLLPIDVSSPIKRRTICECVGHFLGRRYHRCLLVMG